MMRLGSVIIKVEPRQVADTMWYFPLLKPYVHHVPVKPDLSDLEEKIRWCREHDDECRKIADNAKAFYEKYCAKDALLDYVEMACKSIAKRFVKPPDWWVEPPPVQDPPKLRKPDLPCYEDRETKKSRLCVRCKEEATVEEKEIKDAVRRKKKEQKKMKSTKQGLRARMARRAALEKKK